MDYVMSRVCVPPISRLVVCSLVFVTASVDLAQDQAKGKPEQSEIQKKNTQVEPTHWGDVVGRIYDADTGAPIPNATITIQQDGVFADKGQTVDQTDPLGAYKGRAILGRISHNLDVGRLLLSTGIGLLFGSENTNTKRIDVSRLNVQVAAPGYKPYEGPLTAKWQDARAFRIGMEPILLVPNASQGVSTPAMGWGAVRIESVGVEPNIVKPGQKVTLRAWLVAFGSNPSKTVEVVATSRYWRGTKKLKYERQDDGKALFSAEVSIGGGEKLRADSVTFQITKSDLDYSPVQLTAPAILQVAATTNEHDTAIKRQDAIATIFTDKKSAVQKLGELIATGTPTALDYRMQIYVAEDISDYPSAIQASLRLVDKSYSPSADDYLRAAEALHLGGQDEKILGVVDDYIKKIPEKKWLGEFPPALVAYDGISLTKLGEFTRADKLSEKLNQWDDAAADPVVNEFRNNLRLAEVTRDMNAAPDSSAALAEYGRVMMDSGHWEDAIVYLQKASAADPNSFAVKRDLIWANIHLHPETTQDKNIDDAVAAAEEALNIGQGKQESRDFFSWEKYSLLVLTKADRQIHSNDPAAQDSIDKAVQSLRRALVMARAGASHNYGMRNGYGAYLTGSEIAISGFAYPEANSCYILLDSLKALSQNRANYLAEFNLTSALIDLGQGDLAQHNLALLMQMKPDYPEAIFLAALLSRQQGNDEDAQSKFEQVLKINPRHPRANLMMAELLAKNGDPSGAAACLANHAKWYGATMAVRK